MGKLSAVKVGDTIHVCHDMNRMGGGTYVVTKVGRTLVHVGEGYTARKFRIDDGREPGDGVGGYCRAETLAQRKEREEREALCERLTAALLPDRYAFNRWTHLTTDQMRRILAIAEEAAQP